MKLFINTASTYKGGSIQVAKSFLEECKCINRNEYHVILSRYLNNNFETQSFPSNFHFYKINYRPATRVFSYKSATSYLKEIEKKVKPDVVFTTSGPSYWRPKAPHLIGYNLPHYVYPDSPYWSLLSLRKRLKWKWKGKVIRAFFRHDADFYVVQTDDINKRLRRLLTTDKVFTVSNTCSDCYLTPKTFSNKLPDRDKEEFRFLTLSAWYPHKHLEIIPYVIDNISDDLKKKIRFILTLPEKEFKKHFSEIYRKQIINIGPVKIEEGPSLYKECDALFLPTLLECFSASYAESMAMELPILTSNLDFARTICEKAALYFDPMDPQDIAGKIKYLITSLDIREDLVKRGKESLISFGSAKSRAESYLKICENMVVNKG